MYADYVTISVGSVHTTKENAKALVVVRKEIGLEVNVNKTKDMFMSAYQNEKGTTLISLYEFS